MDSHLRLKMIRDFLRGSTADIRARVNALRNKQSNLSTSESLVWALGYIEGLASDHMRSAAPASNPPDGETAPVADNGGGTLLCFGNGVLATFRQERGLPPETSAAQSACTCPSVGINRLCPVHMVTTREPR